MPTNIIYSKYIRYKMFFRNISRKSNLVKVNNLFYKIALLSKYASLKMVQTNGKIAKSPKKSASDSYKNRDIHK